MLRFFATAMRWFALVAALLGGAGQALAQAPVITSPPLSKMARVGDAVTFTVVASGTAPLAYEWSRNGQPIAGATAATLTLPASALSDRGSYRVRVSNSLGNARSYFRLGVAPVGSTVTGWGSNSDGEATPPPGLRDIMSIAGGGDHSLALRADGTVVAWGSNDSRQITVPSGLNQVVAIAAGEDHSVALKADGTVVTWGDIPFSDTPVPEGLNQVVAIAAGAFFTVAAKADGSIVTWGWDRGQQAVPSGLTDIVEVAGGFGHILALNAAGNCVVWGSNFSGQLNTPVGLEQVAGISAAGDANAVVRANGTVVAWGYNAANLPANLANVNSVEAAGLALHTSGTVTAWVDWGKPTAALPPISAISARGGHVLAMVIPEPITILESPRTQSASPGDRVVLEVVVSGTGPFGYQWRKNGLVVGNNGNISGATTDKLVILQAQTGDSGDYSVTITNAAGQVTAAAAKLIVAVPPSLTYAGFSRLVTPGDTVTIGASAAGGESVNYVWRKNGTVIVGASGPSLVLQSIGYSDGGWYHLRVTNAAGGEATYRTHVRVAPAAPGSSIVTWGSNYYGEGASPPAVSSPVGLSAGGGYSTVLRADGTLIQWGLLPEVPPEVRDIVAVSSSRQSLALRADGRALTWGRGYQPPISVPPELRDLVDVVAAVNGEFLAVRSDGTVSAWGAGRPPAGLRQVISIAAGSTHYLALKSDGSVVAWGSNEGGECNVPAGLTDVVAVAAGLNYSMALKRNGIVAVWGVELPNQSATLASLNNVVAISSSMRAAFALRSDGRITAWGSNEAGLVNDSGPLRNVAAISTMSQGLAIAPMPSVRIITQPQNFAAAVGADATFTVTASGEGPLGYQWRKDGVALSDGARITGATTPTLVVRTVGAADAGVYTVQVSSSIASVVSGDAKLTLKPANDDLANARAIAGKSGAVTGNNLTATREPGEPAHGGGLGAHATLWYRWTPTHTGTATIAITQTVIPSETIAVYTGSAYASLSLVTVGQGSVTARAKVIFPVIAGTSYAIVVGTSYGFGLGHGDFTLTYGVETAVGIALQPQSRTALVGGTVTFGVTATGDNLIYQWLHDGEPIAGASGATLTLANLVPSQAGAYAVRVTNASGTVISTAAALAGPNVPPLITSEPQNRTVTAGLPASFSVGANATGRLAYQWRRNGVPISGATLASLTFAAASRGDADYYDVLVYDELSPRTSVTATLAVAPASYPGVFVPMLAEVQPEEPSISSIYALASCADRKFFIGGEFETVDGRCRTNVARFNADGTLDASFVPPLFNGRVEALLPNPDGSVLVGGSFSEVDGLPRHTIVRLKADGTLDSTFHCRTPYANSSNVIGILPLAGGRILVGGRLSGGYHIFVLAQNGTIENSNGSGLFQLMAMTALPGGKILLAGRPDYQRSFTRLNADGTYDSTFVPSFNLGSGEWIEGLAVQADGRVLAAGMLNGANSAGARRIVRMTADGVVDPSYVAAPSLGDAVTAVSVQSSGKAVVSGSQLRVARLNADGSLDVSIPSVSYQNRYIFAVQADDRILGGAANENQIAGPTSVFRLHADATADPSVSGIPRKRAWVLSVAHAPAGQTIVAGNFAFFGGRPAAEVARLNPDGTVDPTFNAVGTPYVVYRVLPQSDRGMLVFGDSTLTRLHADGTPDASFTVGGPLPMSQVAGRLAAVNLPGGRVAVAVATSEWEGRPTGGLVVLKRNGSRDTTFDVGTGFGASSVRSLVLQTDGRLLVAGAFTQFNGQPARGVVRLNYQGARDVTFSAELDAETYIASMVLQPDGKIIVGGGYSTDGNSAGFVARLNANGSRDPGFQARPVGVPVDALLRQEDGRIIVHGSHQTSTSVYATVVLNRLEVDGSLDPTFKVAGQKNRIAAQLLTDGGQLMFANAPDSPYGRRESVGLMVGVTAAPPTATLSPAVYRSSPGATVEFTPTVGGTRPLAFQWLRDGSAIIGATTEKLQLTNIGVGNAGLYSVDVRNAFGAVTSNVILLTGQNPVPTVTHPPLSATVAAGQDVTLTVGATGTGPLAYQWRKDGISIAGATTATLALGAARVATNGTYDVVVSDGLSVVVSPAAVIAVPAVQPSHVISTDPAFAPAFEHPGGLVGGFLRLAGGKTLLFGSFSRVNGTPTRQAARLDASGAVDASFVGPAMDGTIYAAIEQADGRVIVGGNFSVVSGQTRRGIARLKLDGSLDASFAPPGNWINTFALARQPDGRLVLGGAFYGGLGRITPDGVTDASFTGWSNNSVFALQVQSDGRIIAGGAFSIINGVSRGYIARLLADGTLDPGYVPGAGFNQPVYALRSLSDDRLLVAGAFTSFQGVTANRLVRLTSSGGIEPTWSIGSGFNSDVYSISVLEDGRVLAGGAFGGFNGVQRLAIARLYENGGLDATFTPLPFSHAVNAIAALPGGTVIVGGGFSSLAGQTRMAFAQLSTNGASLVGGTAAVGLFSPATVRRLLAAASGKIIAAGDFSFVNSVPQRNLTRLNADGTVDAAFSLGGSGPDATVNDLIELADGRLVVVGEFVEWNGQSRGNAVRLLAQGGVDPTWSMGASLWGGAQRVHAMPDGGVLVLGEVFNSSSIYRRDTLAVLMADGRLDERFTTGAPPIGGSIRAAAVQRDGRILAGGSFVRYGSPAGVGGAPYLVRLLPSGQLDPTFSIQLDGGVTAMAVQPDGGVLVAGDFRVINGVLRPGLARLTANGEFDATFSPDFQLNRAPSLLAPQPDGSIYIAGPFTSAGAHANARYLFRSGRTGSFDSRFGTVGLAAPPTDVGVLADGSLLLGGDLQLGSHWRLGAMKTISMVGPQLVAPPVGGTILAGMPLTLSVGVAGGENVSYQWSRNGVAIPGATGAQYEVVSAQSADAGSYSVRVTHGAGIIDTVPATVVVLPLAPMPAGGITGFGGAIKAGSRWPLAAPAIFAGSGPFAYQWLRDNVEIAGATHATYSPITWQPSDAGEYKVSVRNSEGAVTTDGFSQHVTPAIDWDWRVPMPQGNSLVAVAYLNQRFLAGGARGTILTSTDASAWTTIRLGVSNTVRAFAHGGGTYVAISDFGGIWTSSDALNWTHRSSGVGADGNSLLAVTYAGGRFVAVGSGGAVSISVDGVSWQRIPTGLTDTLTAVASGAGRFIALGAAGRTYHSADGTGWAAGPALARPANVLVFGGGCFVAAAGNNLFVSPDGISWSQRTLATTGSVTSLNYTANGFLAAENTTAGSYWQSLDGGTWSERSLGIPLNAPAAMLTFGAGRYVMVGASPDTMLTSSSGTTWSRIGPVNTMNFVAAAAGEDALVALTKDNDLRVGATGTPSFMFNSRNHFPDARDIACSGTLFVAVGGSGAGRIASATSSETWNYLALDGIPELYGVNYLSGRFFALGATGTMLGSVDGITWTKIPTGSSATLRKAAYGAGTYVAVGSGATILSSSDAITWQPRSANGVNTTINDVIYAAGKFVLVSEGASIRTSLDGVSWTTSVNPLGRALKSVVYAGGKFYAFPSSSTSYLVSGDGVTWVPAQHGNANAIGDAVVFGNRIYLVGANASIVSLLLDAVAPVIASTPAAQSAVAGSAVSFGVDVTGTAPFAYQWYRDGRAILGANARTLTLHNVSPADAGGYTVMVSNAAGSTTSGTATLTVTLVPPGITAGIAQAQGGASALGGVFTVEGAAAKQILIRVLGPALANFGVSGTLDDPRISIVSTASETEFATNDDWSAAANAAQVAAVSAQVGASPLASGSKDAAVLATFPPGTYRIVVGPAGASGVVSLEIYEADTTPRLVYLATRGHVGAGGVITQAVSLAAAPAGRSYLVRALGPSTGLGAALADPRVAVYAGSTLIVANDNWSGDPELASLGAQAGAMPLPAASRDAALKFIPATTGVYTVQVASATGTTGTALLEIFECDANRATGVPVAMVSLPDHVTVNAGESAAFGVVAVGRPAPNFHWSKGGVALAGANTPGLALPGVQLVDAGNYTVTINNGVGLPYTATATLTVTPANNARQAVVGSGYTAGGTVTIANTLHYVGAPASLGWSVELPTGWSFASDSGSAGDGKPVVGSTGTLVWSWNTPPPSPVSFSYTLSVPAGESATRALSASASVGGAAGFAVRPAPLWVFSASRFHSVDIDRDGQVSLLELTRIIELYNTRHSTVRTGAYRPQETTEDGFASEPLRPGGAKVLDRHHAADTNRDGSIGLAELTRVIQLYNFRAGSVRTGQYRVEPGTEDGFAPGP